MNTLRSFPKGQQNCYNLNVNKKTERYLIRAGFCYGNYDGLSSPPTFDLHVDGKKWSTVKTSLSGEPIYHEVMYKTRGSGHISLCVVQVKNGGVPFISSIEAVPLEAAFPLYPEMESSYSFNLVSRVNLGGDEVRYFFVNFFEAIFLNMGIKVQRVTNDCLNAGTQARGSYQMKSITEYGHAEKPRQTAMKSLPNQIPLPKMSLLMM